MAALECWSTRTSIDEEVIEQVLMSTHDRSEAFPTLRSSSSSRTATTRNLITLSNPQNQQNQQTPEWHKKLQKLGRNLADVILKNHRSTSSADEIPEAEFRRLIWGSVVHDLTQLHHGSQLPEKLISDVRRHFDALPVSYSQAGYDVKEVFHHMRIIESFAVSSADGEEENQVVSMEEIGKEPGMNPAFNLAFACRPNFSAQALWWVLENSAVCCRKPVIYKYDRQNIVLGVATVVLQSGQERIFRSQLEAALRTPNGLRRSRQQTARKISLGLCGCQEENIQNAECEIAVFAPEEPDLRQEIAVIPNSLIDPGLLPPFALAVDESLNVKFGSEEIRQWLLNSDNVEFGNRIGSRVSRGSLKGRRNVAITKLHGCDRGQCFTVELRQDLLEITTKGGHCNLVQFYGIVLIGSQGMCVVTKLMEGGSLDRLIRSSKKRLQYREIVKIALDVLEGLIFMRDHGVIFRGLNSRQVLLDRQGNACLGDMGFAVASQGGEELQEYFEGVYRWLAPELLSEIPENMKETEKSSVYSLGMLIWEMLTGETAYESTSPVQAVLDISSGGMRPEIPASCPQFLKSLMLKCWHQNPSKRPHYSDVAISLRGAALLVTA